MKSIIIPDAKMRELIDTGKCEVERVMKVQPEWREKPEGTWCAAGWYWKAPKGVPRLSSFPDKDIFAKHLAEMAAPHQPGQVCAVRESWCYFPKNALDGMGENYYFKAEPLNRDALSIKTMKRNGVVWRSPATMPREASRMSVRIVSVRCELVDGKWRWIEACEVLPKNE
jgi:hypothetical protein